MINAAGLNYTDVFNSLKKGDFYSSQGPLIHEISLDDNTLYIKCSDVCLIVVYTDSRLCYHKKDDVINEVKFDLRGTEKYIRIMLRDKEHRDANSNAYWL